MALYLYLLIFVCNKKKDTIMKTEKKFTWCVRFYNVKSGVIDYLMYFDWSARAIDEFITGFVESNKDYVVRAFKQYKKF